MFDRTIESDPRPAAPQSRAIYRMRDGHRREYDASRDRGSTSFRERCRGALADIGIYGAVSVRDLAEAHFGGHPYTTRRAVNAWIREGLAQETRATGPNGNPFKVLTLTRKGVAEARKLAAERGIDPGQEIGFARTRPAEAAHDTAIYRACGRERQRLTRAGGHRPPCASRRRVQERRSTQERVRAGERRPAGRGRRAAPRGRGARLADRCPRTRALPGCADRVHRLRGTKRTRQHRGRIGQLPGSLHTCQGPRRVPDARQRTGRRAPAPLTRRGRRRRSLLPARADRPGSGRARTLTRPYATLENQRRPQRRTCRLRPPPRRIPPRVPRAVLATDPRRARHPDRPALGAGARHRRGRPLRRRTRRRTRRPRPPRRSPRALRTARRGRSRTHRLATQRRRGRVGVNTALGSAANRRDREVRT